MIDFSIICLCFNVVEIFYTINDNSIVIAIAFIVVYAAFVFKDFVFKNASIGKRIMKIVIVSNENKEVTSSIILKRNITFLLLAFELVFFIINKERLGDLISKTTVVNE